MVRCFPSKANNTSSKNLGKDTPGNHDEEAVDWWRTHQGSLDESDLGHPYQVQKQTPMPQNGYVLNRQVSAPVGGARGRNVQKSRHRSFSHSKRKKRDSTVQRFEPDVVSAGRILPLSAENSSERDGEIISIISKTSPKRVSARNSSEKRPLNEPLSDTKSLERPNEVSDKEESEKASYPNEATGNLTFNKEAVDASPFCNLFGEDDGEDRLSDVGSDVDPVSREQYLLACKMLKAALIDKERNLAASEREFLFNILKESSGEPVEDPAPAKKVKSKIPKNLHWNPHSEPTVVSPTKKIPNNLHWNPNVVKPRKVSSTVSTKSSSVSAASPTAPDGLSKSQSTSNTSSTAPKKEEAVEITKVPSTFTGPKQQKQSFGISSIPCGPGAIEEAETEVDIVLNIKEEGGFNKGGFDQEDTLEAGPVVNVDEDEPSDKTLDPSDRDFILGLVKDFGTSELNGGSTISRKKLSKLKNISQRLEIHGKVKKSNIPKNLHWNPHVERFEAKKSTVHSKTKTIPVASPVAIAPPSAPTEEKSMEEKLNEAPQTLPPANQTQSVIPTFTMPSIPCGPTSLKEEETKTNMVLMSKQKEISDDAERSDSDDRLVRFDGWAEQRARDYPFSILGADDDDQLHPRVLTPSMMEAFRGFLPYTVTDANFWLKFSVARDGASLSTLLATLRASTYTIIGVETSNGEVFGAFTGTPWRSSTRWYGNGESFLWRLKNSRIALSKNIKEAGTDNEMEVYPFTGYDNLVQYCTSKTIAIGGGDWDDQKCPFDDEPKGIGLMIDGDLAGGETNSCATFANPRLCKTTSSNEFSIANVEVWTLTPFDNENDAAQLEMQKLYIEENS